MTVESNPTTATQSYNRPLLYLRSLCFWICSVLNTLLMAIPVLGSSLFSYRLAANLAKVWAKTNLFALKLFCNLSCEVEGEENIPADGCIVLSKHQSTWETYFLYITLPHCAFVAKKSLLWIPIFGWAIAALRFIMIDRGSGRVAVVQMIEQARERLSRGISIVIFPEGTRMPPGAAPNYRIGGAAVAEQTGAGVLPVAVNSGEFWPRMGFIKWPGKISVRIGPVISTEGKTANAIMDETQGWIEGEMAKISRPDRFPY